MTSDEEQRLTLTCASCGFVVSVSRFQAEIQGWYIAAHPPAVALCASCASHESVGVEASPDAVKASSREGAA
jgi:hypothetical protein